MIAPALRRRTTDALAAAEQEEGVRILLAIESSSRAHSLRPVGYAASQPKRRTLAMAFSL